MTRDELFRTRLAEVEAFVKENGRFPTNVSGEQRLGQWLSTQRRARKTGALPPERATALDGLPGWDASPVQSRWERNLADLKAFVAVHGRPHARAHDTTCVEHRLAVWLMNTRAEARRRPLDPQRKAALDEVVPGWDDSRGRDTSMSWEDVVDAVVDFRERTGKFPTYTKHDDGERRLGSWLAQQRAQFRRRVRGTGIVLSDERLAILDERLPGWRNRA